MALLSRKIKWKMELSQNIYKSDENKYEKFFG